MQTQSTLFLWCFVLFSISVTAQSIVTGTEANAIIKGSETVKLVSYSKVPEYIRFRKGGEIPFALLNSFLEKTYFPDDGFGLEPVSSFTDELGIAHYRYRQMYQGIPVEGSAYIAHVSQNNIISLNGILFSEITSSQKQNMDGETARTKAVKYVSGKLPLLNPSTKIIWNTEQGSPPNGFLIWVPENGDFTSNRFRLSYRFDIYATEPLFRAYVFVDAESGKILYEKNRIQTADATGSAVTKYSGTQTIITDSYSGSYRLREAGRGNGIQTFDMNTGTNYGSAVDFTDADNFWNNVNANQDEVATDAHWGAEMTYDYYKNIHNRNSIDNNGFLLKSYVHYSSGYNNAFWDGQRMTYGDGSGSYGPFTALDITGHEITHGLTEQTANLNYSYESGALNESFSDIFGTAIEFYGKPSQANWLVGENIGVTLRSMSNPNAYGDPDTYQGTNWYTGSADNGGVHTNSNVQNFWFYLLSQGGSGTNDIGNSYSVTGLGITNAAKIAFRTLTVYLTSTSQYADSRFYSIQSAIDLFGPCTQEVIATTNAWYAVGVGGAFNAAVTADFSSPNTSSCSTPLTSNFTNLSTNAGSYYWNFGDGNTSSLVNPSHVYNTYGTFTVTLVATGGTCGADTMIKTAYIQVDSTLPCVVIMPVAATGDVQTSCTGTVYDNGGPSGNYADNNTSIITIAPTGAATVTLNIVSFDIEPGSGAGLCDYDHVEFFDGPNTSSTSLGRYCNNIMPPANITSSGSAITIKHYADQAVNNAGFRFNWSCTPASTPPVANFSSDVTSTCTGEVSFSDLSTNGPTAWSWIFGDGGTSTLQNPTYTYASNGTYTVQLTATNAYGSDAEVKTAYVTVNKPTPPTVTPASRCGAGTVTLSASGSGNLGWYTDTIGGTLTASGSSFTTPVLTSTTSYYVEDVIIPASQYVGPQTNGIGNGANYTGNRYLIFHCYSPVTLVSVLVYAQGGANRTIQLRDKKGNVITDTTMYVQDGATRITLNFNVPVADSLQLGIAGTPNLYRNSTGPSYPYTLAGLISIIQSSAALQGAYTYYYFFYDWEIREPICTSERAKVTATINPVPTASIPLTNSPACYGGCNGSAMATATSGTTPYSYSWSNGQNTSIASNLCNGNYCVTVTDNKGCVSSACASITQPAAISLSLSETNATCGNSNGTAGVIPSNGTPPYSYLWSNSAATQNISNLAAANYFVTVTDNNGCSSASSIMVNNDVPVAAIQSSSDATCYGSSDGQAAATASGGTPPYTYIWSNGATQAVISGLQAGNYTVSVTDISNCISAASVTITQPQAISVIPNVTDASCGASCNGSATFSESGGTPPYSYSWTGGGTNTSATGLCAGNYSVTVTDNNGCSEPVFFTVNGGSGFTVGISSLTNSSCGVCDGSVTVNTTGGNAPFTYLWNDPGNQTYASASGLCGGNYTVTVTDAAGCTYAKTVSIFSQGGFISSISSINNTSCYGGSDGSVTVSVTGGAPPYSYQWNAAADSQTTATATGLQSGFYSVTITDTSNCITSAAVNVGQPQPITVAVSPGDTICMGGNTLVSATPTGGNGVYTYFWDNGLPNAPSNVVSPLSTTTYTVIVLDQNNCTSAGYTITVFVDVCTEANAPGVSDGKIIIEPNPFSESATIFLQGFNSSGFNSQGMQFTMFDVFGREVSGFVIPGSVNSFILKRGILPDGIYFYKITDGEKNVNEGKIIIL